ncbi:unnamed protein product [Gongylonema pulchrum]|uniref:Uncharacterized protein n=1 Tax=Gongylonema pulchrum TaxID=637853 RepID=A0A183EX20_9BILA|nr:unnamed protein product [Gongylonema pulchrum]
MIVQWGSAWATRMDAVADMDELLNELEASENSTQPPPAASDSDVRHLVSDDHALCNIISGENENTDSPADSRPEATTIIEVADARSPESHESTGSLLHTTDNRFGEDLVQNKVGLSAEADSNSKEIIGEMQNQDDVDDPQGSESTAEDVTAEEDRNEVAFFLRTQSFSLKDRSDCLLFVPKRKYL